MIVGVLVCLCICLLAQFLVCLFLCVVVVCVCPFVSESVCSLFVSLFVWRVVVVFCGCTFGCGSALRVPPAETRLTVYRRLDIEMQLPVASAFVIFSASQSWSIKYFVMPASGRSTSAMLVCRLLGLR